MSIEAIPLDLISYEEFTDRYIDPYTQMPVVDPQRLPCGHVVSQQFLPYQRGLFAADACMEKLACTRCDVEYEIGTVTELDPVEVARIQEFVNTHPWNDTMNYQAVIEASNQWYTHGIEVLSGCIQNTIHLFIGLVNAVGTDLQQDN